MELEIFSVLTNGMLILESSDEKNLKTSSNKGRKRRRVN